MGIEDFLNDCRAGLRDGARPEEVGRAIRWLEWLVGARSEALEGAVDVEAIRVLLGKDTCGMWRHRLKGLDTRKHSTIAVLRELAEIIDGLVERQNTPTIPPLMVVRKR